MLEWRIIEEARVDSGNLSAERLANALGITLTQLARVVNKDSSNLRKRPDADVYQAELSEVEEVLALVREQVGTLERARMWLKKPNAGLGGMSPLVVMEDGHTDRVKGLLVSVLEGVPA